MVTLVSARLLPLSFVEAPEFKDLMQLADPRYTLPSRKHLTNQLIPAKTTEIENKLKKVFQDLKNVCVTVDIWTSKQMRSFLGVTVHFIKDWVLHSALLACHRFKGRHTSENISQQFEELVSHYNIKDKVSHIVTDNAANMVKAFDICLPGFYSENPSEETTELDGSTSDSDSDTDFTLSENSLTSDPQNYNSSADLLQFLPK